MSEELPQALKFKPHPFLKSLTLFTAFFAAIMAVVTIKTYAPTTAFRPAQSNKLSLHVPATVTTVELEETLTKLQEKFPYFSKISTLKDHEILNLLSLDGVADAQGLPTIIELTVKPRFLYSINYKKLQNFLEEHLPDAILEYNIGRQDVLANGFDKLTTSILAAFALFLMLVTFYYVFIFEIQRHNKFIRLSLYLGGSRQYLHKIFLPLKSHYIRTHILGSLAIWGAVFILDLYYSSQQQRLFEHLNINLNLEDYGMLLILHLIIGFALVRTMIGWLLDTSIRQQLVDSSNAGA